MLLDLRYIKPSTQPIRSSWDEDKLQELTESIREQGVIVPIKVRPVEDLPGPCGGHGYRAVTRENAPPNESGDRDDHIVECPTCDKMVSWAWPARVIDGEEWDPWEQIGEEMPPTNPPFEIVYGHRRVEAARRAGLTEIEAVVEGVDDTNTLIQALIENTQREDMAPLDKARAYRNLMAATGWSQTELQRRGIASHQLVSALVQLLDEPEVIQSMIVNPGPGTPTKEERGITWAHVSVVRETGIPAAGREAVLAKANEELLSRSETRRVAEAYRDARTDEERAAVLKVRGDHPAFERAVEVQSGIDRAEEIKTRTIQRKHQEHDREVAEFFDAVRAFMVVVETMTTAVDFGKFSPEGAKFAIRRIDSLIEKLQELKEQLNHE